MPIPLIVLGRLFFAGLISLPYFFFNPKIVLQISWPAYVGRAFLRYVGTFCSYYGYSHLSLQTATAIGATEPFFATLLSVLTGSETLSRRKLRWLVLGYLSALISSLGKSSQGSFEITPIAFLILANLLSATGILLSRHFTFKDGVGGATAAISILMPPMSLIGLSFFGREGAYQIWASRWLMLLLGLIGILHTSLFHLATRNSSPSFVSSFQYTKIPLVVFLDRVFFNIPPDPYAIVGSIGVALVALQMGREGS